MWKEYLETKVIRIEGLDLPDLTTKVSISNQLLIELNPYNLDHAFELPKKSTCQLLLKSQSSEEELSVKFNTKIFEEDGMHWLPLFSNLQQDLLNELPEEVTTPRILVLLAKKTSMDVIKEGGELSELDSECEENYMPEIRICQSFIESGIEGESDDADEQQDQEVTEINGAANVTQGVVEEINHELKNQLEKLVKILEIERKSKDYLESQLEVIKNSKNVEIEEGKKREEEILEAYKKSEAKLSEAKFELTRLAYQQNALKSENVRLSQQIESISTTSAIKIDELTKKISIYESAQLQSDNLLTKLSDIGAGADSTLLSKKLQEKEEEISLLKKEILAFQQKPAKPPTPATILDDLDFAVQKYAKIHKIPYKLQRDKEQTYIYNNKKVSMLLKDGQVLCRVGGIFKPFEEHMKALMQSDFILAHNSSRPAIETNRSFDATKSKTIVRKPSKSLTQSSKSSSRRSLYN